MSVPFFDIKKQNAILKDRIDEAIARVVASGHYILGENVSALEKEAAAYCGTEYAVGVASGTDAIHLALRACGIKSGDEVITSPFTFVATTEAIAYCNATPVFADIEPKTFNIDPLEIEKKVTKKTKVILVVHLYGQTCEMDKITALAKRYNLKIIEDCAQAMGTEYQGKKVGSLGAAGCFSFFPTKNLGCFGDGGMVTTNDENIYNEIKVLRGHGSRTTYHYDLIGYNSRLDELQAAILRVKLPLLDDWIKNRTGHAKTYRDQLKEIKDLSLPSEIQNTHHSYNQFTVRAKKRDALFAYLKEKQIGSMVYYPLSLHLQKAFAYLNYKKGDFPESELVQEEVLSLPIFPEISQKEIETVTSAIKEFYRQ